LITRTSFTSTRPHVWSIDPAIDKENPAYDWKEFLDKGDLKYLPAVEGGTLTVFNIKALSRRQFTRVFNIEGLNQFSEAVAFGLKSVANFRVDGTEVDLRLVKVDGEERVSEDSLNKIFDPMLFAELGLRILEISRLHP
jgi:hypothetical protein